MEKELANKDNMVDWAFEAFCHMDQVLPFMRTFDIISTVHHWDSLFF
jgi:hypothetical protein